jgi:hypothetical protein
MLREPPERAHRGRRAGSPRGAAGSTPTEPFHFGVYDLLTQSTAHARPHRFAGRRHSTLKPGLFGCKIAGGSPLVPRGLQQKNRKT